MTAFLLVGLGGALGAMARFGVGRMLGATALPWATLIVNVSGGLAMGLLAGWLAARSSGGESWRLLLGVGVLGGFTTFSAFSLDMMLLIERGQAGIAIAYALASVLLALGALAAGLWIARSLTA
ncbi:fluoride efflux transporter CrcB [Sandaracinobacter neustonicus]|uniref:Fluoride-specific ion channel FluC n=1 Tax=Sandaracinobacter neustonicus TaxID=1715348 RepID=A0A501XRJ8_9SPHN|nr:fluoride efflux transporter CrcB [Sandaracinobacter neustonicus]TPE62844.1 fluoride efflux transporter CrcB [Sandaracinobacter neustonicus]